MTVSDSSCSTHVRDSLPCTDFPTPPFHISPLQTGWLGWRGPQSSPSPTPCHGLAAPPGQTSGFVVALMLALPQYLWAGAAERRPPRYECFSVRLQTPAWTSADLLNISSPHPAFCSLKIWLLCKFQITLHWMSGFSELCKIPLFL